jgi:tRNA wybutosine-synthesizing protein 4
VYEQIEPNDGFGLVMQQHFSKLGIPLLSLPVYQNKDLQKRRYREKVCLSLLLQIS